MSDSKLIVVGLTGQTGAGKTTISEAFAQAGFAVINADLISREVSDSPAVLAKLETAFGREILTEDGKLNRRKMAELVFGKDRELLQKLEGILYPPITSAIQAKIDACQAAGQYHILLDAPTLFEAGANKLCTHTVSVLADADLRRERIMARDGLTLEQAQARMASQPNDAFYRRKSDYILYNNATQAQLAEQGSLLAKRLTTPKSGKSIWLLTVAVILGILLISACYTLLFRGFYPKKYEAFVSRYAQEYQVEESLVYAVIRCESSFRPDAVSSVGARGLMQIMEDTYDWAKSKLGESAEHSYEDLFDPALNIQYGTFILSLLLDEFEEPATALAAYHAGWGNVKKWLADRNYSSNGVTLNEIPFPTTDGYVDDVLAAQKMYERLY